MHIYNELNEISGEKQHAAKISNTFLSEFYHTISSWKFCDCAECNIFFQEKTREERLAKKARQQRATERLAEFAIEERKDIADVMSIISAKTPAQQKQFLTNLKNLLAL